MADTKRGYWPKEICSDCRESGVVIFKHWGPLVPEGKIGCFCLFCWNKREKDCKEGKQPKSLGVAPQAMVMKNFIYKKIEVITKSRSIYFLGRPDGNMVRTVYANNKKLPFKLCRVVCLIKEEPLYLIPIDGGENVILWLTTPVVSIKGKEDW